MVVNMRDIGSKTKRMAREDSFMLMVMYMKVIGLMIKLMDMEFIHI